MLYFLFTFSSISERLMHVYALNYFSAKGNIKVFANNTDSGESARNELSHLKSALFAFWLSK